MGADQGLGDYLVACSKAQDPHYDTEPKHKAAAGEGGRPTRVKPRVCIERCWNAICEVCYATLKPGSILPAGPWSCSDVEGLPWDSTCVSFGYVE